MSREIGKQVAPFTMFSSSADGGYLTDLHSKFTGSVELNNLHLDEYGSLVGAPLQGPFAERWVGGHQHRHQEVFSTTDRGEAFYIKPESATIKVYGADYPDVHAVRAVLTRDGLAKRALNIANVRTSTGSLSQGNYDHNIQVVQTSGKTLNPRHFAENSEAYQQFAERKGNRDDLENLFNTPVGRKIGLVPKYTESFEGVVTSPGSQAGNPGSWFNGSGSFDGSSIANGRKWSSDVDDTSSTGTGPNGPHHGTKYLFAETSGNNTGFPNKYFTLSRSFSPTQSKDLRKMSLYYHMYGETTGQLFFLTSSNGHTFTQLEGKVTRDADNIAGTFAVNQDNISGEQQTATTDSYRRAEVDLSELAGQSFWIMIAAQSTSNFTSDIAIDKIEFIYPEARTNIPSLVNTTRNFALPTGSANKSIITNRFSAPGDRYTMSKGFLNPSGEEFSVYNTLPYRNESVRQNLRDSLSKHMSAQGYEVTDSTVTTTGSLHKVNRNTLRQLEGGAEGTPVTTGSVKDNFYIQHPIPRSDLAYAWVTASISNTAMSSLYGYQKNSNDISFNLPEKNFTIRSRISFNPDTNTSLLPLGGEITSQRNYNILSTGSMTSSVAFTYLGGTVATVSSSAGLFTAAAAVNGIQFYKTVGDNSQEIGNGVDGYGVLAPSYLDPYVSSEPYTKTIDMISASDGNVYVLAGCPNNDNNASNAGEAYLYKIGNIEDPTSYTHWNGASVSTRNNTVELTASDLASSDLFGTSVSVVSSSQGIFSLIGAWAEDTGASTAGSAYLFRTYNGYTKQIQVIRNPAPNLQDDFGRGIDIVSGSDGLYCAIGESSNFDHGSGGPSNAHVYKVTGLNFSSISKISTFTPADEAAVQNGFGSALSIFSSSYDHGVYIAAGCQEYDKAFLFNMTADGTTTQVATLTASNPSADTGDKFGQQVDVKVARDGRIYTFVGAQDINHAGSNSRGASFAYETFEGVTRQLHSFSSSLSQSSALADDFGAGISMLIDEDNEQKIYYVSGEPRDSSVASGRGIVNINVLNLALSSSHAKPTRAPNYSWGPLRRTDNKPIRFFRDNSTFSFWTSDNKAYENTAVITQSAVTSKYKPIQHIATIANDVSETPFTFRSTYSNELNFFDEQKNVDIEAKLDLNKNDEETFYSSVKDFYIQPEADNTNNPFGSVSGVKISETVYPKGKSTYTAGTRSRINYTEISGTGPNGQDKQYGKQNTFFHSTNLRSSSTVGSFGFISSPTISPEKTTNFVFDLSKGLPSTLTSQNSKGLLLDAASGSVAFKFGNAGESRDDLRSLEFTFEVSGATSISFDHVKGGYYASEPSGYAPLSIEAPDQGDELFIQYKVKGSDIGWQTAYVSDGTNPIQKAELSASQNTSLGRQTYVTLKDYFENVNSATLSFSSELVPLVKADGKIFDNNTKIRIVQINHDGSEYDHYAIRNLTLKSREVTSPHQSRAFFPLRTDGLESFPLSSSYEGRNGELLVDKDESAYTSNPTPSQCFVESTSLVKDGVLSDYVERTTNKLAGTNPWEDSYDDYREDFRGLAKDMSVLPEFKISDHLDEYYTDFNFAKPPTDYLTLQGGDIAKGEVIDTGVENFFDRFTTSEPLRDYKQFLEDHAEEGLEIKSMKIKVDAVKKLLPYNGFYPMTRTVQLGNLLSSSFIENITGKEKGIAGFDTQGFQAISKTLMSPGILYNSIKAGYGVSYPIYKNSPSTVIDSAGADKNVYEDFHIESAPDYQIPFDALLNPKGNIPENEDIVFTPSWTSTTPAAPSYDYSGQWNGTAKPQFQLGMHNFLAETVKFFLKDGQLVSHVSEPQKEGFEVEAGKTYYMDVVLRDNIKMDRMSTYSGTVTSSAQTHLQRSLVWDSIHGADGFYLVTRESPHVDKSITTGFPPRISMFKKTFDGNDWELLDSFTHLGDRINYTSPVRMCSGSEGFFVGERSTAEGNRVLENPKALDELRIYRFDPVEKKFDNKNIDYISPQYIETGFTNWAANSDYYDYFGKDFRIVAMAEGGYALLSAFHHQNDLTFNISASAGFSSTTVQKTLKGANYERSDGALILYTSSSVDGIKERNIFHNTSPHNANYAYFATAGTFDMVSASFSDTIDSHSSSYGGLIISAGAPLLSGSVSTKNSGSFSVYYSGSVFGTASFLQENFFTDNEAATGLGMGYDGDYFGHKTSIASNSTAPNRLFYVAASSTAYLNSSLRKSGSVTLHTGSFKVVSNADAPFARIAQIEFGPTVKINDSYFNNSGFHEQTEFGSSGTARYMFTSSLNTQKTGFGSFGDNISLITSRPETDGESNKLYLLAANPASRYDHGSDDTRVTGSVMIFEIDGNGFVGGDKTEGTYGNFTFLSNRVITESGMNKQMHFAGAAYDFQRSNWRPQFKIFSASLNPYNAGEELVAITSHSVYDTVWPRMNDANVMGGIPLYGYDLTNINPISNAYDYAEASSDRVFIMMHTGSAFSVNNRITGSFSSTGNREAHNQFSASLEIKSDFTYRKDGALYGQPVENAYDPAYCAYTPPSYYGPSIARISYTAPEHGGAVTIPQIFRDAYVEEIVQVDSDKTAQFYSNSNKLTKLMKKSKMPLSSSVNLFGARVPRVDNSFDFRDVQWVIGSRFESPVLDFEPNDTAHNNLYASQNSSMLGGFNFIENSSHLPARTMWTSYGSVPSNDKGVTLELKESFDSGLTNTSRTGSMIELCGFKADSKKMGELSKDKTISEAIVLIPYVKGGFGPSGIGNGRKAMKRAFKFSNSNAEVETRSANIKQFTNNHSFIPIKASTFNSQFKKLQDGEDPETTITKMIQGMEKFILPPHMDFLKAYKKNGNKWTGSPLLPFAMYFIEVEHDLDQEDLLNIWQGVMPGIARNFDGEELSHVLEHNLDEDNLFHEPKLLKRAVAQNLSFMVFKVKQRAESNFFNVTKDSIDDFRYQFDFDGDGIKEAVPEYSYNWPYDFFSLIETAKVTIDLNLEEIPAPEPIQLIELPTIAQPVLSFNPIKTTRPIRGAVTPTRGPVTIKKVSPKMKKEKIKKTKIKRNKIKEKVKRSIKKPTTKVKKAIKRKRKPKVKPRIRRFR